VDPDWNVVLLHEPRSRRILHEKDEYWIGLARQANIPANNVNNQVVREPASTEEVQEEHVVVDED
jgi:hypothetical protein